MAERKRYDVIIFLTSQYPFGEGESFIENEIGFLTQNCEKLVVIPFRGSARRHCRLEQEGSVEIIRLRDSWFEWLLALLIGFFSAKVWKEWSYLWKTHQWSAYKCGCVLYFFAKARIRFSQVLPIMRKLAEKRRKLIYCYWAGVQAYVAAKIKCMDKSFVAVTRAHGFDLWQDLPIYLPFREETFQAMDGIYPVSGRGAEHLCERFSAMKRKIFACYLGTRDYGLNAIVARQVFHIVSCSNMIALKRIHLIIEALSMMRQQIRWTHYGDGPLKADLEKQARALPRCIRWEFKGYMPNQALMREYQVEGIDLFVNVSETEGLPVSIMEAMSFGIPVIATRVGGMPEIVSDGVNGYLLPADLSGADLQNAIEKFLRLSQGEKDNMRANSRRLWGKRFSANKNYKDFYAKLIEFIK